MSYAYQSWYISQSKRETFLGSEWKGCDYSDSTLQIHINKLFMINNRSCHMDYTSITTPSNYIDK